MDSLKSLMDKKQYELVIKITDKSNDATSLFYRISALLATNRGVDALMCIEANRKVLESDLTILIKIHIEILCLLGDFDKAYAEMKYYQELPYVSQQVEEILQSLPELIRLEERKSFGSKQLDEEQLKSLLNSNEVSDVVMAIDIVRERNYKDYICNIKNIMVNFPKQSIRSFALMLLVQKGYDQEVNFKQINNIVKVNPSKLDAPFVGEKFNTLIKKMQINFKNPALAETATQLLASHIIYTYPQELQFEQEVIIEALYFVASDYLKSPIDSSLEERCEKQHLDINKVRDAIDTINNSLSEF